MKIKLKKLNSILDETFDNLLIDNESPIEILKKYKDIVKQKLLEYKVKSITCNIKYNNYSDVENLFEVIPLKNFMILKKYITEVMNKKNHIGNLHLALALKNILEHWLNENGFNCSEFDTNIIVKDDIQLPKWIPDFCY